MGGAIETRWRVGTTADAARSCSVYTACSRPLRSRRRNTAASYLRSDSSILHAMLPPQPQTANHLLVGHAFAAVLIGDHDDQRNPGSNSGEQLG